MTFKFDSQLFTQVLFVFNCCGIIYIAPKVIGTCIMYGIIYGLEFYISRNPNISYTLEQRNDICVKHYDLSSKIFELHYYKDHSIE